MKTPDEIKKALEYCTFTIEDGCEQCPYYNPKSKLKVKLCMEKMRFDVSIYIRQLENRHADDEKTMDFLFAQKEAIERDFGDFAARVNAGEDLMACEYCKKNYAEGECNCNCLKDFEWRGLKSVT